MIHQVKSYIRTVLTYVSKDHIQKYFDEFTYQINRSQKKKTIWHNTIMKKVNQKPITQKQIVWKLN